MSKKKLMTVGERFLEILKKTSEEKIPQAKRHKLLNLAKAVIRRSPSQRGMKVRGLPESAEAIRMEAITAQFQARTGKDVSTDKMLMMIANAYRVNGFGSPKKFKEDFKKKFPEEYNMVPDDNHKTVNMTPKTFSVKKEAVRA